jgi:hypothetical protein
MESLDVFECDAAELSESARTLDAPREDLQETRVAVAA